MNVEQAMDGSDRRPGRMPEVPHNKFLLSEVAARAQAAGASSVVAKAAALKSLVAGRPVAEVVSRMTTNLDLELAGVRVDRREEELARRRTAEAMRRLGVTDG